MYALPSNVTVISSDAHLLAPRQLLILLNRGNREVGAATVKGTLAIIKAIEVNFQQRVIHKNETEETPLNEGETGREQDFVLDTAETR